MNKNKYTLRLFLAVIIVLSLIVAQIECLEGFSDSLTLVDANNLIDERYTITKRAKANKSRT